VVGDAFLLQRGLLREEDVFVFGLVDGVLASLAGHQQLRDHVQLALHESLLQNLGQTLRNLLTLV